MQVDESKSSQKITTILFIILFITSTTSLVLTLTVSHLKVNAEPYMIDQSSNIYIMSKYQGSKNHHRVLVLTGIFLSPK